MRFNVYFFIGVIVMLCAVGYYIRSCIKSRVTQPDRRKMWLRVFYCVAATMVALWLVILDIAMLHPSDGLFSVLTWLMMIFASVTLSAVAFTIVDLFSWIPKLWHKPRCKWVTFGAMGVSAALFVSMWVGSCINRLRIDVKEVTVEVKDLPQSFDGFKIVQISDLHISSFAGHHGFVDRIVDRINALDPDLIVFTGDIVSRHAEELEPYVESLSRLHARYGQYAILGNHDYAAYYGYKSEKQRAANVDRLRKLYAQTSMTLLEDETRWIKIGGDSIALIGVGYIGNPPFVTYGSLDKAYDDLSDGVTKVLLSHDPDHWADDIVDNPDINVALTLSGHTHASQVHFLGISPGEWIHPYNEGLYHDESGRHTLYVNHGAGTVGVPMRMGATPEITLITLTPAAK